MAARDAKQTGTHLRSSGRQKVIHLLVDVDRPLEILDTADLGLDKMVTVDGGRNGSGVHASGHELEDGHLGWENDVKNFSYAC